MYKPSPEPFRLHALGQRNKPHIVVGDFNSHSTFWRYTTTNSDGEYVEQWADSNNLSLIHNAKLPKSFNSTIWKKGYNPDLIFVSSSISDMCEKSVLDPIPRTQHHPICVTENPIIVPQPTIAKVLSGSNMKKTNWDGFSPEIDAAIEEVNSIPENFGRFIELLRVDDVDQTTYLVSRRSPRVSMKHTKDCIQATLQQANNLGFRAPSGSKQCSANASQRTRSQYFGDNQRLSPY